MKTLIDLDSWSRKEHFQFFQQFEEPFYGVCVTIDCTRAYKKAKEKGYSFFLYYLHKSLMAANEVLPFRYRTEEGKVYEYDAVHASPTIMRPDGTFGFSYMNFHQDFIQFQEEAQVEINRVQNSQGLFPAVSGENVIHFSSLPWIDFTSLSHARSYSFKDSSPKISFGKMTGTSEGKKSMPVSVHVNHALVDGYHVGQFIDRFQELMNE